jgi:para-aminobenzoate synthetase component I
VRTFRSFAIKHFSDFKKQMLNWGDQFNICCFLDNHQYDFPLHSQECLLAAGAHSFLSENAGDAFFSLKEFIDQNPDWLFGHFAYDLKNEIENLHSNHVDTLGFPDMFFFVPEILLILNDDEISVGTLHGKHEEILNSIWRHHSIRKTQHRTYPLQIKQKFSRESYVQTVELLRQHILRGDCYEINFCQEFFLESFFADPLGLYESLMAVSPNPFSAYYKLHDRYLLCASPERYLKKKGNLLFSQPIKGTSVRDPLNAELDESNRLNLYQSEKDRSENVMVVDLVRNDLAKICQEGSVRVEELFGIYSFPQVHQMISTVSGTMRIDIDIVDAFKATFPMGSMTGAPKKKVMELIEQYERTRRGLFSGAVGYISPDLDFDFNVVIRSILYNSANNYLSFQAGSGITFYSDAVKEYEECLLKALAIQKALHLIN